MIPCVEEAHDDGSFPRLPMYERDHIPAQQRSKAFETTWECALKRMRALVHKLYEPSVARLRERLSVGRSLLVPATILDLSGSATYEALPAWLSDELAQSERVTVHLMPAHCANLAHALAAFVAQIIQYIPSTPELLRMSQGYEPNDLALIPALFSAADRALPQIVLLVHEVQTFPVAVMNDALAAILTWSELTCPAPSLHILLSYTAPLPALPRVKKLSDVNQSGPSSAASTTAHVPAGSEADIATEAWHTYLLTERVRSCLDVSTVSFPDKSTFWEDVLCVFFAEPVSGLWLGRSLFELVRRRFWHTSPSWDAAAQCIRLSYVEHFRARPLSAFVHKFPDIDALHQHWTAEMLAHMRVTLFSSYMHTQRMSSRMRMLAHDDRALVSALSGLQSDMVVCMTHRAVALATVREMLRLLHMTGVYGTKLGLSACTALALEWLPPYTDWDASRTAVNALTATTPTSQQVQALLNHLCSTLNQAQVTQLVNGLRQRLNDIAASLDVGAAAVVRMICSDLELAHQQQRPLKRVRSELGAIATTMAAETDASDASDAGRAVLAEWVTSTWQKATEAPSDLGLAIWTYDFAEPVSCALDGAARATVLLALDAPTDMLASMSAATCTASGQREQSEQAPWLELDDHISEVDELRRVHRDLNCASIPDVCRLYALYKDTSKFINLADWYDAFAQSLEGDERRREQQRRQRDGQEAPPCTDASDSVVTSPQMRFSLAVNELAYMGLLGPSSRKVEHLSRLVWDLPVNGMDEM